MNTSSTKGWISEDDFNQEARRLLDARWTTVADMDQDELDLDISADWRAGCTPHEAAFNLAVKHGAI